MLTGFRLARLRYCSALCCLYARKGGITCENVDLLDAEIIFTYHRFKYGWKVGLVRGGLKDTLNNQMK